MAQTQRVQGVATTVSNDGLYTRVRYHVTDVVLFNEHRIVLNSGGYRTNTTKTRMNQASNQFGLGYRVYQKRGEWFISYKGETLEYRDDITLRR